MNPFVMEPIEMTVHIGTPLSLRYDEKALHTLQQFRFPPGGLRAGADNDRFEAVLYLWAGLEGSGTDLALEDLDTMCRAHPAKCQDALQTIKERLRTEEIALPNMR